MTRSESDFKSCPLCDWTGTNRQQHMQLAHSYGAMQRANIVPPPQSDLEPCPIEVCPEQHHRDMARQQSELSRAGVADEIEAIGRDIEAIVRERDELRAEVDRLRPLVEPMRIDRDQLRAERDQLKAGAQRARWVKEAGIQMDLRLAAEAEVARLERVAKNLADALRSEHGLDCSIDALLEYDGKAPRAF